MKTSCGHILVATVIVLGARGAAKGVEARFRGLGDLPGGSFWSMAGGMARNGSAIVGRSNSASGNTEPFLWTEAGGMVGLGFPPGGYTTGSGCGVSDDGTIVVGAAYRSSDPEPFLWRNGSGMVTLVPSSGSIYGEAFALTVDGAVVVGYCGGQAFRWTVSTGMVGLGDIPGGGTWSSARAISSDGDVIGGTGSSVQGYEAYRWTQGTGMTGLGDLPGGPFYSDTCAISADGNLVVGYSKSTTGEYGTGGEGFRWTEATGMVGLGDLPGGDYHSLANGVSADGQVVVGFGTSTSWHQALIWDSRGMRILEDVLTLDCGLDLLGWQLLEAVAVSDDGLTITGNGINPEGRREAWMAVIPEPGSLSLLSLGGLAVVRQRRR